MSKHYTSHPVTNHQLAANPMKDPRGTGEWGVLVKDITDIKIDDTVQVTVFTKSGKTWTGTYRIVGKAGSDGFGLKVHGRPSARPGGTYNIDHSNTEMGHNSGHIDS